MIYLKKLVKNDLNQCKNGKLFWNESLISPFNILPWIFWNPVVVIGDYAFTILSNIFNNIFKIKNIVRGNALFEMGAFVFLLPPLGLIDGG